MKDKLGEGFIENENGQTESNFDLSTLVTRPGFEPRQSESESDVLPLYYRAIKSKGKISRIIFFHANKKKSFFLTFF